MQPFLKKYGKRVLFPGALIIGLLYFFLQQNESSSIEIIPAIANEQQPEIEYVEPIITPLVLVDVKGQVKFPGVYELTAEDRIIDAINLAGGYTDLAETKMINHAQRLQDEMVIYIPQKGEEVEIEFVVVAGISTNGSTSSSGKININKADETELQTLPGVGPAKAQAIVAYRSEVGKFQSIDDLKKVSGIGEKSFERLKDLIDAK
ncbi:helix-hairpin-helix domain-containing protein [Solibacillus sp. CAU 1738]|uniref:helix-hairpin-helix domain-containing protein n=1 Tax=Solibacillus sp. CAU 1738 TaxID=3140363 RepID=UPI003261D10C